MVVPSHKQQERTMAVIKTMLENDMSYREIGAAFGLNKGQIWYFYNDGIIPKGKDAQQKLGLEEGAEIIISIRHRRSDGTFKGGKQNVKQH